MAPSDGEAEVAGEGEAEVVSQIQKMREEVQSLIATMREGRPSAARAPRAS